VIMPRSIGRKPVAHGLPVNWYKAGFSREAWPQLAKLIFLIPFFV
jgi:hypothetical protein